MFKKQILAILSLVLGLMLTATPVYAHAVVKPATAGIGSFTDFTLGVPSEKDSATIMVKIILPEGINSVTPIVKPGWKVEVGPTAIVWTGGQVPAHQKDFFVFSTQVPSKEVELDWRVEQTYLDGSMVSWSKSASEQPKDEKGNPDFSKFGPYSKTMVVNDLKATPTPVGIPVSEKSASTKLPLTFSLIALAISAVALALTLKKRQQ